MVMCGNWRGGVWELRGLRRLREQGRQGEELYGLLIIDNGYVTFHLPLHPISASVRHIIPPFPIPRSLFPFFRIPNSEFRISINSSCRERINSVRCYRSTNCEGGWGLGDCAIEYRRLLTRCLMLLRVALPRGSGAPWQRPNCWQRLPPKLGDSW